MNSAIVAAVITAIATVLAAFIPLIRAKKKKQIIDPKKKKNWWSIIFCTGFILIVLVIYIFWPKWYVLDSGNYHLGDNVFRMDQEERPDFQSPGGTNIDSLVFYDKDNGEFYNSSSYTPYPDPKLWKDLHLENYIEVEAGNYYLNYVVVGYTKTFDLRDLLENSKRIFRPKLLIIDFLVFDLISKETEGGLFFVLNNGLYQIKVNSLNDYERYKWSNIEKIIIPINILNYDLNTISFFVMPKYSFYNDKRYYHFEDTEISNIKLKVY